MAQFTTFSTRVAPLAEQAFRVDKVDLTNDILAYSNSALVETSIEPQRKNITPWDGPLFFSVLVTFCVFIALALLSPSTFDEHVKVKPLKLHLITQPLKDSKLSIKEIPIEKQQKSPPIDQKTSKTEDNYAASANINAEPGPTEKKQLSKPLLNKTLLNKPLLNKTHHMAAPHTKEKKPQVTRSLHVLDLIQTVIKDENRSAILDRESGDDKNTGPHNTVFDDKLRQYLHSEELRQFNRRRHRVDIGNYSDSSTEHFSDGNGNCFRIIDNVGETLWVPKKCPKVQSKQTEFGRLISVFD